jgi:asparagine synthase (glutamine-hydrolysing)
VGVISLRHDQPVPEEVVTAMAATLIHRGPDAEGYFRGTGIGFGFRRLSIVDLQSGDQPMFSEDGNVVMICNGEIFNHRELRDRLIARNHVFRTQCDVEVLVHLYEEEGMGLLGEVNGQFAFALYDQARRQLFLARDHLGILPLYYTTTADQLVFASEIKAIVQHPGVSPEVDLTGLDQILSFPGMVSPRTMFRGIHALENGEYLSLRDGQIRRVRYWDLDYPPEGADLECADEDYYVDALHELLSRSVRRRLRADVPVGLYLSGGLDSSLIAALASEEATGVDSFSIAFPGSPIDESAHQRHMSAVIGSRHHESECDVSYIADHLQQMVFHAECPVKETYNTCSLRLSEMAHAAGTKAVLSGEGADELFGGYAGYRFDHSRRSRDIPADGLEAALEEDISRRLWGDPAIRYERNYHAWRQTKAEIYSAEMAASLDDFDCTNFPLVDQSKLAGRHSVHQRSYLDVRLRLSDHLLADHGDRMALTHSVEVRYPFLDREVVEFATKIPACLKVNDHGEKYVLRRMARRLVPAPIVEREKFGFRAPASPALLRRNAEWINDLLSPARIKRQGYFNAAVVEHLRTKFLAEGSDIHPHLTDDLLLIVLTFGILLDAFGLPGHS